MSCHDYLQPSWVKSAPAWSPARLPGVVYVEHEKLKEHEGQVRHHASRHAPRGEAKSRVEHPKSVGCMPKMMKNALLLLVSDDDARPADARTPPFADGSPRVVITVYVRTERRAI